MLLGCLRRDLGSSIWASSCCWSHGIFITSGVPSTSLGKYRGLGALEDELWLLTCSCFYFVHVCSLSTAVGFGWFHTSIEHAPVNEEKAFYFSLSFMVLDSNLFLPSLCRVWSWFLDSSHSSTLLNTSMHSFGLVLFLNATIKPSFRLQSLQRLSYVPDSSTHL